MKLNKVLFLLLLVSLVMSLGIVISCGDDDDDDDDDDDADDDDDDTTMTCAEAMDFMYGTCGLTYDGVTEDEAAAGCDLYLEGDETYAGYGCALLCAEASDDCTTFEACVQAC